MPSVSREKGSTDFGWIASDYSKVRGGGERTAALAQFLEPHLPEVGRVLDAGGGPGLVAQALSTDDRSIVALDISVSMADESKRVLPRTTIVADIHALPFAEDSFDAVMLVWVVNHLADLSAAAREVTRVAKLGAKILYLSGVPTHPPWDIPGEMLSRLDVLRAHVTAEAAVLTGQLSAAGFVPAFDGSYTVRFRQRPHALASRIEARQYGHLRSVSDSDWNSVVSPVIHELRALADQDSYLDRENRHRFIVFQNHYHSRD